MYKPKWSMFFVCLLLGSVAARCARAADAEPNPADAPVEAVSPEGKARLEVIESEVFDFGALQEGETDLVEHEFKFKNVGEEPLILKNVKPSCGCTAAVPSATTFAPGATGTLKASMKPKGKFGNQSISVRVETNDPTNPTQIFRMTGSILSPWRVVPAIVDFRDLGRGETRARTVHMMSQYFKDAEIHNITGIKSDHEAVTAATKEFRMPEAPQKGKDYLEFQRPVEITVTAGEKMGDQSAKVFVFTDDPKNATHTIHVRWKVSGDLDVSVQRVVSTRIRGRNVPRPLKIQSRSGTPFEVLSIDIKENDGGEGILELTPEEGNTPTQKTYQVTIKEGAEDRRQPYLGTITVKVNHPEQKEVSVPYTASVRD
jgi:hypothetical protein